MPETLKFVVYNIRQICSLKYLNPQLLQTTIQNLQQTTTPLNTCMYI